MSINAIWIQVLCDRCKTEIEVELEPDPYHPGSWTQDANILYESLKNLEWSWYWLWVEYGQYFCPACSVSPTKEDIDDYKAYHAGEGIHTP